MLKKHRRITNYYCPRSPKRFTILDQSVLRREWTSTEPASEDHNDNLSEISGIIDSWKVNKRFASLVAGLGITPKDASEAADDIMDWRPRRGLAKGLDDNIIRDFIEEQLGQRDDEMIVDYSDELRRRQALQVIGIWRCSKISMKQIALKLKVPLTLIKTTIKEYKVKVKQMLKLSKSRANKRRKVVDSECVARIEAFCKANSRKLLTLEDIQYGVWTKPPKEAWPSVFAEEAESGLVVPSKATVARAFKRDLSMSYRVVKLKHNKTSTVGYKSAYVAAVLIQKALILIIIMMFFFIFLFFFF